jgi:hypothetical protein
MSPVRRPSSPPTPPAAGRVAIRVLSAAFLAAGALACTSSMPSGAAAPAPINISTTPPSPDPRIGLKAGLHDAGEATWNMHVLSENRPSQRFDGATNSDLAFLGQYAIQGSYNGFQVWDISNPANPTLRTAYFCPASQSDVSVYRNLLFVSAEAPSARLDCGAGGVKDTVSTERLRGLRIFDITDIANPKYIANVQTCRGSHTHTLLVDPKDAENVYIYISGSSVARSPSELAGCSRASLATDPNTALFRIEVIKVPLAHPERAAIVSSPRIFQGLTAPTGHGDAPEDAVARAAARARGEFTADLIGLQIPLPPDFVKYMLDSVVKARGGRGNPTAADSAALRAALPGMSAQLLGLDWKGGPTQCHDITVYPAIGFAGGACEGYGLLLDIHDPAHPVRVGAVSDSNFAYWHSASFNNDGTKMLFTDEWGGGSAPKCRASDPREWGADAIFTLANGQMKFQGYYKLPAPQTPQENCVAHNGSLVPIPGRDVMVQAWYQGGISVFDFTDPAHAKEIAFFDRGPVDPNRMVEGGSWSAYWYNGVIVSSEIARGLDIVELTPSGLLSANEIEAAKSVHLDQFNAQDQPKIVWPATFALSRAYLDQLERNHGLAADRIASARQALASAERLSGQQRKDALTQLATQLHADARTAGDATKAHVLAYSVGDLANAPR